MGQLDSMFGSKESSLQRYLSELHLESLLELREYVTLYKRLRFLEGGVKEAEVMGREDRSNRRSFAS